MHNNIIAWSDANGNVDYLKLNLSKIQHAGQFNLLSRPTNAFKWLKPTADTTWWKKLIWRARRKLFTSKVQ
jgi:hypothetical protein